MKIVTWVLTVCCVLSLAGPVFAEKGDSEASLETRVEMLQAQIDELNALVLSLMKRLDSQDHAPSDSLPVPGTEGRSALASADSPPSSAPPPATPVPQGGSGADDFTTYWKEGIRVESSDSAFKLKVAGRIQADFASFKVSDELQDAVRLPIEDGSRFRSIRLGVSGTVYDRVEFKVDYDFASQFNSLKDVYIGIRKIPVVGNFKVGHMKEPFGIERLTSSNNTTFMERASPSGFSDTRNTGMLIHNTVANQNIGWAVGAFRDSNNNGSSLGSSGLNFTGRVNGTPLYRNSGRDVFHLGFAASRQSVPLNTALFGSRPESRVAPPFVATPLFAADSYRLYGAEAAYVRGPFSLQSEYNWADLTSEQAGDPGYNGYYVLGSFFLTGENRPYDRSRGAFGRVRPRTTAFRDGLGAWELAARYSDLDLTDDIADGGRMRNFTFGLNWYLNPITRFAFNYVYSDVEDAGTGNIFQMRFKIDF